MIGPDAAFGAPRPDHKPGGYQSETDDAVGDSECEFAVVGDPFGRYGEAESGWPKDLPKAGHS